MDKLFGYFKTHLLLSSFHFGGNRVLSEGKILKGIHIFVADKVFIQIKIHALVFFWGSITALGLGWHFVSGSKNKTNIKKETFLLNSLFFSNSAFTVIFFLRQDSIRN